MRSSKQKIRKYKKNHPTDSLSKIKDNSHQSSSESEPLTLLMDDHHPKIIKGSESWDGKKNGVNTSSRMFTSQGHSVAKSYHRLK